MAAGVEDFVVEAGDHVVHLYDGESELADTVGRYLSDAVEAGAVAIVIATEPHRRAFAAELETAGVDPASLCVDGTLILLDAAATMASFMPEGQIDPTRFREIIGSIVRQAGETGRPVRAYGEMVALLWDAGDVLAAIELEKLWNELGCELRFALMCGYHSHSVQGDEHAEALEQVCHLHSTVLRTSTHEGPKAAGSGDAEISAEFSGDQDAPRSARHFVADVFAGWGYAGTMLEDAELLVTELATNAVLHARSPFSVTAQAEESGVRLLVADQSHVMPAVRDGGPTAPSGRGLRLVAALAAAWGVELTAAGKTVWAELKP